MKLIPAIDLINGKCVRLTKGAYDTKKEYHSNPTEVALNFEKMGKNDTDWFPRVPGIRNTHFS